MFFGKTIEIPLWISIEFLYRDNAAINYIYSIENNTYKDFFKSIVTITVSTTILFTRTKETIRKTWPTRITSLFRASRPDTLYTSGRLKGRVYQIRGMKKRTFAWRVCNSFVWTLHGIFSDYVGHQPPPSVEKEAVGGAARRKIPSETSWSRDEGCFDRGKAYSNYCARGNPFERGKQKTFITAVFRWLGEQVEQDFRVIPAAPCLLLVPTRIFIRNGLSGA